VEQDGDAELLLAHIGMACSSVKHLHLRWCGPEDLDLTPLFKVSCSVSLKGATFDNCRLPRVESMADSWLQSRIEKLVVRGSGSDAAEIYLGSLPSLIISACVRSCPYSSAYSPGNVDASTLVTPDVLQ
jgi:hypothetical protein